MGHVSRMDPERLPRQVLRGELSVGTRPVGRPKLRYKDVSKPTLKDFHIDTDCWENVAGDIALWKITVYNGMEIFAEDWTMLDQQRRARRHRARLNQNDPVADGGYVCWNCQRVCRSRIGLFSHEQACRRAAM